jgi:hypothetical protein
LHDRLTTLTGVAADRPGGTQVEALCQALARAGHPVTVLRWLSYGHSAALLTRLLDHDGPLTHQHLDALPASKAVHYIRDVLVCAGVPPATSTSSGSRPGSTSSSPPGRPAMPA